MKDKAATGKKQDFQEHTNESEKIESTENKIGDSGKLSDYPDGNIEVSTSEADDPAVNQNDLSQPVGRTMAEATDPSKLSDI